MGEGAGRASSTVTGDPGRRGGTSIHHAEEVRFEKPTPPTFGYAGSALSVLSLLVMFLLAGITFIVVAGN